MLDAALPDQPRQVARRRSPARASRPAGGARATGGLGRRRQVARAVAGGAGVELVRRAGRARARGTPAAAPRCTLPDGDGSSGTPASCTRKVVAALGLPARTCATELDLDVLAAPAHGRARTAVSPPSRSPRRTSPWSSTADVPAADVEAALREGAGRAAGVPAAVRRLHRRRRSARASKSLAYALRFRAPDRTLTAEEVNALRDRAVASAAAATGAVQRGA